MNKTLLLTLTVFCLITSCKTNEVSETAKDECKLFNIGNYVFYNPRVYEVPVIFKKGSHALLHDDYVPVWYSGYCAENLPSFFKTKEDFLKHVHSKMKQYKGDLFYEQKYEAYKTDSVGLNNIYHEGYHLLFRGTVSVKNLSSGNEYLLVEGKNYIENESDYDKNTEFYESDVKSMFAFLLEDGIYKFVDIDYVIGNFTKQQNDKVFSILSTKTLINQTCVENVNNIKKPNFDRSELPGWVYNKSELDE
ncbi:hypothetical protein CJ739_1403 [Mariniflexile rhizosphaerae]|uniref:hypothetical protein n=1 Tax=unclassified Mariniflexile TaxID=2643887 RepID=UPI000CC693E2|nr:hypothetical protein [Mariniflexile sp. TRM1-10]AXP80492.1 hypothetical protein CJ739_1403 [Mariniflexile sp. TRM1-10]PLB20033.1 MAG: hypothetical protein TRG1_978 [Flavobacteriaceae bacterium FS1-H7996/R]